MFTDKDTSFHTPDDVSYSWGETNFYYFYVPEANVIGVVYFVARAGVGTIIAEVEIWGGLSLDVVRAWYVDVQQSLPIPDRFALPNGLSFEAHGIRSYRIDYVGFKDTELHLTSPASWSRTTSTTRRWTRSRLRRGPPEAQASARCTRRTST